MSYNPGMFTPNQSTAQKISSIPGTSQSTSPAIQTSPTGQKFVDDKSRQQSVLVQTSTSSRSSSRSRGSSSPSTSTTPTPEPTPAPVSEPKTAPTGDVYVDDPSRQRSQIIYRPGEVASAETSVSQSGLSVTGQYTGQFFQAPGETREQFSQRRSTTIQSVAQREADFYAKQSPGTAVEVQLRYEFDDSKVRDPFTQKLPPQKDPAVIGSKEMKKDSEFVVSFPEEKKKWSAESTLRASELASFGEQTKKYDVAQSWEIPGKDKIMVTGGAQPGIKGRGFTQRVGFEIEKVAAKIQGREADTRISIDAVDRTLQGTGFTFAGKVLGRAKDFVSASPLSDSSDIVYPRGGEFLLGAVFSAGQSTTKDPLKYAGLFVGGAVVGGAIGAGAGALSTISTSSKVGAVISAGSSVVKPVGILGAGALGVLGVADIRMSGDPVKRAGEYVAEGVALGGAFTAYKSAFKSTQLGITKPFKITDTTPFVPPRGLRVLDTPGGRVVGFLDDSGALVLQREAQTTLTGRYVSDKSLQSVPAFSDVKSPLGLGKDVTYLSRSKPDLYDFRSSVPDTRGFTISSETGTGVKLDPFRFGTRTKPLSEFGISSQRVYVQDVKLGVSLEVTPRGFERLLMSDPNRFKFVGGENVGLVSTPRFGSSGDGSVQQVLKIYDTSSGKPFLTSVSPSKPKTSNVKSFMDGKLFAFPVPVPVAEIQAVSTAINVGATRASSAVSGYVQRQVLTSPRKVSINFAPPVPSFNIPVSTFSPSTAVVTSGVMKKEGVSKSDSRRQSFFAVGSSLVQSERVGVGQKSDNILDLRLGSRGRTKTESALASSLVPDTESVVDFVPPPPTIVTGGGGGGGGGFGGGGFVPPPFIPPAPRFSPPSGGGGRRGFFSRGVVSPTIKSASAGAGFLTRGVQTLRLGGESWERRNVSSSRKRKVFDDDFNFGFGKKKKRKKSFGVFNL